jgi:hypothetical protein
LGYDHPGAEAAERTPSSTGKETMSDHRRAAPGFGIVVDVDAYQGVHERR